MSEALPARVSSDGRMATWNPGLSRARQVVITVLLADGKVEERPTTNSGRARVLAPERILAVRPAT
jgi:hypothetical protein